MLATAQPEATVERVHNVPFTVRTFTVERTLRGTDPATLPVRELGAPDEPMVTRAGQRYLLFLRTFEFEHGVQHKGQFTPSAAQPASTPSTPTPPRAPTPNPHAHPPPSTLQHSPPQAPRPETTAEPAPVNRGDREFEPPARVECV